MRFKYKVIGTDGEVSCNVDVESDVASDVASRTRYKNLVPTGYSTRGAEISQPPPTYRVRRGEGRIQGGEGRITTRAKRPCMIMEFFHQRERLENL
jgi:hypothetical protein